MAVHVTLYRYTDEGLKGLKNAGEIARRWQQEAQKRGIQVKALYWLEGPYDAMTVVESNDDDAVMGLLFSICAQGLMRTETMRGYGLEDVERIAGKLGA